MLLSTACLLPPLVRSLSHSISLPLSSARMLSLPIHPLLHSVHPLLLSALMISLSTYTLFRSTYQFYRQWIQGAEKNRLPCASSNNCKSHRAAVNKTGLQQNWRERAGIFLTSLLLYSEDYDVVLSFSIIIAFRVLWWSLLMQDATLRRLSGRRCRRRFILSPKSLNDTLLPAIFHAPRTIASFAKKTNREDSHREGPLCLYLE